MGKLFKELFFLILFIAIIVIIVGILFYEYIPSSILPKSEEYSQSESTARLIAQIDDDVKNKKENTENAILKSYELTADDLSIYTQSQVYDSGKSNPFYDNLQSVGNKKVDIAVEEKEVEDTSVEADKQETDSLNIETNKQEIASVNIETDKSNLDNNATQEDKKENNDDKEENDKNEVDLGDEKDETNDLQTSSTTSISSATVSDKKVNESPSNDSGWYSSSKTK